ncbi:MAG: M48 family metalloprotease [Alphaproteobacteria bacterium]|nr:M48 family metalloprotease [Alphaproteobacteria bacterium]
MSQASSLRSPFRPGGWLFRLGWCLALFFTFAHNVSFLAHAQGADDQLKFIRDAEIENYLRELATPIYRAADIDPRSVTIAIIESNIINAFVAEGMNEFFYTGLLQLTDTPEQLAGVIAHETGHISGGHLIRGREEMRNASAQAILGMLIAVAAGAATGSGQAAAGALSGAQQIAMRGLLKFSRTQESSADAAGMSFLDRSGMTSRGMMEFFGKMAGQEMLPADRQVEFVRTHPLTGDRIDAVRQHLENSSLKDAKLDPKFYTMHERMKAKLLGYLQPETALLRYTDKDPRLPARYARAIALYRTSRADRALALVDGLIKEEPSNPFFYELKGQILMENGRVQEAVGNYKKSVELLPDSSLLRQAYAHALLETKDAARLDLAIQQLIEANRLEDRMPFTWHLLAVSWGRKAELTKDTQYEGMATYALAEEAVAQGHDKAAGQLADRAMKALPKSTPYWLRAQDIKLTTAPEDTDSGKDTRDKGDGKD